MGKMIIKWHIIKLVPNGTAKLTIHKEKKLNFYLRVARLVDKRFNILDIMQIMLVGRRFVRT